MFQNKLDSRLCNHHWYSTQDICTCCQCMSHHIQSLKCSRHSDDTQHTFLTEGDTHYPRNTELEIKIEPHIIIHFHIQNHRSILNICTSHCSTRHHNEQNTHQKLNRIRPIGGKLIISCETKISYFRYRCGRCVQNCC